MLRRPLEPGQYLAIRYTERLAEAGAVTSVGSRGDSYDNALAETIIGLYKTELVRRRGPWRGIDDLEYATLEWVDWFNHRRLLEPIGYVPPVEFEAAFHRQETPATLLDSSNQASDEPGAVHLVRMRATWVLAVFSLRYRVWASSALDRPRASSLRTSTSRGARSASSGGGWWWAEPAAELLDQPSGHRGGEQRPAGGDHADRRQHLLFGPSLSRKPLAPARSAS